MSYIHDYLSAQLLDDPPRRQPLSPEELASHALRHPADRVWRLIKSAAILQVAVAAALFIVWYFKRSTPLLFCALVPLASAIGLWINGISNNGGARRLTPDVFIGWPFSKAAGPITVTSKRVASLAAFLWPTWGVVSLIPPSDGEPDYREETGFRGAQWPYILRMSDDSKWREAVEWLISQCQLAIFDRTQGLHENLNWEAESARRILGPKCVAEIEHTAARQAVVKTDGVVLKPPDSVVGLLPLDNESVDREEFLLLCAIRAWAVKALPVSKEAARNREQWNRVDRVLPHLSNGFLFLMTILLVAAFLTWLRR